MASLLKSRIRNSLKSSKKSRTATPPKRATNLLTPNPLILAIDPSLNSTGYAVFDMATGKVVELGLIKPTKDALQTAKMAEVYTAIDSLIAKYQPGVIVCEDQFAKLNAQTLMKLSHVRGMVMLLAGQYHLPFVLYSPGEVKKVVADNGRASKSDVYLAVKDYFQNEPEGAKWLSSPKVIEQGKYKNDDVSDALAIAQAHWLLQNGRLA